MKKHGFYGKINKLGEEVVACEYLDTEMRFMKFLYSDYEYIGIFVEGLATVKRDGSWGYIDMSGNEVIPCRYHYCEDFCNGYAKVMHVRDGEIRSLIDKAGRRIISFCEEIEHFKEGISKVKFKGKYHFLNEAGKPIGHDKEGFENACEFHEGLAAVMKKGKWGFIDKSGKLVIDFLYDEVRNFSEGMAYFANGEIIGFIDKSGKEMIPRHVDYWGENQCYQELEDFHEGLSAARSDFEWGYIDKEGNIVIECQFDEAGNFNDGVANVKKYASDLYADIDKSCNIIANYFEPDDNEIRELSYYARMREGYRKAINEEKKYGFLDNDKNEAIPFQYDYVDDFHNGLAIICKDGHWGVLDKQGNETIFPFGFYNLKYVSNNLIKYQSPYGGLWGLILRKK